MTSLTALLNFTSTQGIIATLLTVPGFILFLSFRGFFQAWTARRLGDDTPTRCGFLTMNPLAHIDIIGFVCLLLVGFGYGKPMQFSSRNYKNIKRDGAIQILSAPVSGLVLAFLLYGVYTLLLIIGKCTGIWEAKYFTVLCLMLQYAFYISISVTVFWFLPLPGFDSYKLIANFLPYRYYRKLYTIEKYNLFIFLGFLVVLQLFPVIELILLDIPTAFLTRILSAPWRLLQQIIL